MPAVLTSTIVVVSARHARGWVESCLHQHWSEPPIGSTAVVRIGVEGESVTLSDPKRHRIYACDNSSAARLGFSWCGLVYGRTVGRVPLDPRLDLGGCLADDGRPIAFAWVEPGPRTRFVVVHRATFAEVYEVAATLPVRITTTERIDLERSQATFDVAEHSSSGRLLRRYQLDARVAG